MTNDLFSFAQERPTPPLPPAAAEGSLRGAWMRFAQNRSSVVAGAIVLLLLSFALLAPALSPYGVSFRDGFYRSMPPLFAPNITLSGPQALVDYYSSMGAVRSVRSADGDYFTLTVDAYARIGYIYVDLSEGEFLALQDYQNATGRQICYPVPENHAVFYPAVKSAANLWYELADESVYSTGESAHHDEKGDPIFVPAYLQAQTDYRSLRLEGDPGTWVYGVKNQTGYRCRVLYREYYRYRNGFAPRNFLGTNQHGQDILICLASGARLSFGLSLSVSIVNLLIGLCYGALEGYYGGKTDLLLERLADILGAVPFLVIATLFQLYLAQQAGPILSLLFSFLLTGWLGIAARVRTQFYRFKGEQYVLCARTLGAGDGRIIFRHILPNALGTVVTSAVLLIPGVIFSESMLSYLGIVNLESANLTSLGTMLAGGRAYLSSYPHILAFPAVFIALLEISFNLLGNGLRDALDPMQSEPR